MTEPNKQPRPFDAVLGGNSPPKKPAKESMPKVDKPSKTKTAGKAVASRTTQKSTTKVNKTAQTKKIDKAVANTDVETSADGCGVTAKWIIWAGALIVNLCNPATNSSPLYAFINTCCWAWIVGLINPGWVICLGLPKSRWTVTFLYLGTAVPYLLISSP